MTGSTASMKAARLIRIGKVVIFCYCLACQWPERTDSVENRDAFSVRQCTPSFSQKRKNTGKNPDGRLWVAKRPPDPNRWKNRRKMALSGNAISPGKQVLPSVPDEKYHQWLTVSRPPRRFAHRSETGRECVPEPSFRRILTPPVAHSPRIFQHTSRHFIDLLT